MDRIQELFICPDIHNGHYAISRIEHSSILTYRFVPVQYAVASQTGLLSTAECIEAGINSKAGLMTCFYECLKVIPIGAAFHTGIDTVDPSSHKIHLGTFVCPEQHIATGSCRPYINYNVCKATICDHCHIARDILLAVTVIREIGVSFNPYEGTLFCDSRCRVFPFIREDRYCTLFITRADCE